MLLVIKKEVNFVWLPMNIDYRRNIPKDYPCFKEKNFIHLSVDKLRFRVPDHKRSKAEQLLADHDQKSPSWQVVRSAFSQVRRFYSKLP